MISKKIWLLAASLFILSFTVQAAEQKIFCASYYAFYYKKEIEKLPNDKSMHCTMSCYLAVKCPREEAALIGYLKEFWDIIGPGDFDYNDMRANKEGIKLSKYKSLPYCKSACLKKYVKKKRKK
jgi:hypothetical protein